jgi:hypothetical protein
MLIASRSEMSDAKKVRIALCGTRKKFAASYSKLRRFGESFLGPVRYSFTDLLIDGDKLVASEGCDDGEVDVVLLKLSGAPAESIGAFDRWLASQPNCESITLVEPLERIAPTLMRSAFYSRLSCMEKELASMGFGVLPWAALPATEDEDQDFPVLAAAGFRSTRTDEGQQEDRQLWIVKTDAACGLQTTHIMAVFAATPAQSEVTMGELRAFLAPFGVSRTHDLIVQSFVADWRCPFIFKVYLIEGEVVAVQPSSTAGLLHAVDAQISKGESAFVFDSQTAAAAQPPEAADLHSNLFAIGTDAHALLVSAARMIHRHPQHGFHIDLLGLDVVVRMPVGDGGGGGSPELFVVDVNYYPGYRGVEDLEERLLRLLVTRLEKDRRERTD